jgi:uncharacterized protein
MVTPDANILIYAYNAGDTRHLAARSWLEEMLSGTEIFAFSWMSIMAFLRIASHSRSFPRPYSISEITAIVEDWLACENVVLLTPSPRHWEILNDLITDGQATGPLVMDAHLAALAKEHDAVLATTDKDFSRFNGLKTINPLEN